MKLKFFIPVILCFSLFVRMQAQVPEKKDGIIHLGVWYPLSTNGKLAKEYTNDFSFHLFYGVSKSERTFIFSGLASSVKEDATGLQIAGLGNIIGGKATGLTFSGLGNITGEAIGMQLAGLGNISQDMRGLQFSGLGNISQDITGLQIAGLTNISQDVTGMQFSGLADIAQNVIGTQLSGLVNVSENIVGFQFSGLVNTSQNMKGVQFSGLANISMPSKGAQISGLVNISDEMDGFQFSGLGNISHYVKGAQISGLGNITKMITGFQFGGLFNVAGYVNGVQMAGLVNIADHSDYPIGLVNLIKDGEKNIGITFDELQNIVVAFRSGGRILYGILGAGYCFKSSENLMVLEGGFGAHINIIPKFRINTELTYTTMTQFDHLEISRSSVRVLPAFKFTPHFEVFAGPSFSFLQTNDPALYDLFSDWSLWDDLNSSGSKSQFNIGYTVGLQYCF